MCVCVCVCVCVCFVYCFGIFDQNLNPFHFYFIFQWRDFFPQKQNLLIRSNNLMSLEHFNRKQRPIQDPVKHL